MGHARRRARPILRHTAIFLNVGWVERLRETQHLTTLTPTQALKQALWISYACSLITKPKAA